jgi:hypothetical protein
MREWDVFPSFRSGALDDDEIDPAQEVFLNWSA